MPEFRFQGPIRSAGAAKLPVGLGRLIFIGLGALAVGIVLNRWLGRDVSEPWIWIAATLIASTLTVGISAFGFYRDRVRARREAECLDKLRAADEKGEKVLKKYYRSI